ncbi:4Fe-4S binding protein [Butyricicoccus pullicaecorum]|uniref:4Fe-4S ferredoxin n=1 Tax=Butyricicoccus pullicaecorum TaxID=501571 RepID=A0A1Y4LS05_9FIRM|nr:4Fe-4S binding protein [Butyricicoccus pullicaecorum]OUP57072.1 4Fe-4S ferredoxin [Butyricicoccus pullicaecorum]
MTCKLIVFSPTGGTQRAAELLAEPFQPIAETIDLCAMHTDFSKTTLTSDDLCIVVVPSFAGRVPATAVERLRQMQGNGARAVLVAVYGNRAFEDTLVELQDVLTEQGFHCIAGVGALAEHSIARQFAAGRPDVQDAAVLADFGRKIADKLANNDDSIPTFPGNRPYRPYTPSPMHPQGNAEVCTKCGACVAACPVGAIASDQPYETQEHCISCMRCVKVCPQHTRTLNPAMLAGLTQKLSAVCEGRKENELFL